MTTLRYNYHIQLKDRVTGKAIITSGGKCYVAGDGVPAKANCTDSAGTAATNPVTPTRGMIDFWSTAAVVDLYILTSTGHFIVLTGITPSGPNEVEVSTDRIRQTMIIPFSIADTAAATETDTGFDIPSKAQMLDRLHGCGLRVIAIDATEDIDVGTLSSESGGDADGLIAASDMDVLGMVTGTNGALFSSNAPYKSDAQTAKSISYTLTTGSDTGTGYIILPYNVYVA